MALSCSGTMGLQLADRPDMVLTEEGCCRASPAVDCLGPGQSSVLLHHGDSDVASLPRLLQASGERDLLGTMEALA